jgi:hypothetical protein
VSSAIGYLPVPYCECQCGVLAVETYLSTRSAGALSSNAIWPSTAHPYPDTETTLAAESFPDIIGLQGIVALTDATVVSYPVAFAAAMPSAAYAVRLLLAGSVSTSSVVSSQTASGFTITLSPGIATGTIHWSAVFGAGASGIQNCAQPLATNQTRYGTTTETSGTETGDPVSSSTYINTSTDDQDNSDTPPTPTLSAFLQDGKYRFRVALPGPWVTGNTITIYWRERTAAYAGTVTASGIYGSSATTYTGAESGEITYVTKSEVLVPNAGDIEAWGTQQTILHSALALGATVSVVGPAEIGTYLVLEQDEYNQLSLGGFTVAASVTRSGFLPYIRINAESGNSDSLETLGIYATETATQTAASSTSYSGYQTTTPPTSGSAYNPGFSDSVPADYQSVQDGGPPWLHLLRDAASVQPTQATYANGLIMTLSDPITVAAMTAAAAAQIAAILAEAPYPALGIGSAVLAQRFLPPDQLSYAVAQSQCVPSFLFWVTTGIPTNISASTTDPPTTPPPPPNPPVVADWSGAIIVTFDLLQTNLDTGETTDLPPLSFTVATGGSLASSESRGSGGAKAWGVNVAPGTAAWTAVVQPIATPSSNLRITFSNPQVTTGSLDAWLGAPQAVVSDD